MIVFLEKVRVKTIFSVFEPVKVEPLELCYIKTVLNNMNVENYLIDILFGLKQPKSIEPDIVVLTGYNVSEKEIIKSARQYKIKYPRVRIIVGGVHIQGNRNDFRVRDVDYVFHSQSLNTFKLLIEKILRNNKEVLSTGVDSYVENSSGGYWYIGDDEIIYQNEEVVADRNIFYQISNKVRYLEKRKVALIKSGVGCLYNCSYCYCKEVNSNHYINANYKRMAEEMKSIDANYFWIVDDVLFSTRSDALEMIDIIKKGNLKIKIIAYLRADFILKERDLLKDLREVGLVEVIVGFEATNNDELKAYEKTTNALDYPEIIRILRENNIDLTALFMVQPDYGIKEFKNLRKFIKNNSIDVFSISIFTPIKGTKIYEQSKPNLTTQDPRKFDFMHLVLKSKIPKWKFYILFYGTHISLLKSMRIWRYIARR
ncbi:radical SAM superfamily enzyme YgiQ (UPF0313 family) [Sedimentibacter acidaminivorans]|uniref:Radical SAM superfamily enzyme YgiQ (UPF0313 family) n=1 Tax=Sedimentibacter acidaminivorans TaxID=913099 RepID=A0ABS4GE91_9FIRM|nr:radical SAM protein [Sedimentibacter acidaminivorans]MBP1926017.1 radical SAM superfamily enzyme YgiQ (UPF0313 family) [Sedimentibacter acidaminivorans]